MKNRRRNTLFGLVAIALGVLLLLPMLGGVAMRRQMIERVQTVETARSTSVTESELLENSQRFDHHHADFRGHRGRGGLFHLIGGLIKLAALGVAAYLLYRFFQQRRNGTTSDNVEDDIRVGDEIDDNPKAQATPDPEEMSVDDLVAAMKRLGIKKLEL